MKYLVTTLLLITFLLSCAKKTDEVVLKSETLNVDVKITNVYTVKYSKVYGIFTHNGITYTVDNYLSGYYYKKYHLIPGQVIKTTIRLDYVSVNGGVLIRPSTLDVDKYKY